MRKIIFLLLLMLLLILASVFLKGNFMVASPPTVKSNQGEIHKIAPHISPAEVKKLCPELEDNINTFFSLIKRKTTPVHFLYTKELNGNIIIQGIYKITLPSGYFVRLSVHYRGEFLEDVYLVEGAFADEKTFILNDEISLEVDSDYTYVYLSVHDKNKLRFADYQLNGIVSYGWKNGDRFELYNGEKISLKMGADNCYIQDGRELPLDEVSKWEMDFFKALNESENSILLEIISELKKLPDLLPKNQEH